jgi:hypothetical protein
LWNFTNEDAIKIKNKHDAAYLGLFTYPYMPPQSRETFPLTLQGGDSRNQNVMEPNNRGWDRRAWNQHFHEVFSKLNSFTYCTVQYCTVLCTESNRQFRERFAESVFVRQTFQLNILWPSKIYLFKSVFNFICSDQD